MLKFFKRILNIFILPVTRFRKMQSWQEYLKKNTKIKLLVGAGYSEYKDWFTTDVSTLDLTDEQSFKRYFSDRKIDNILAEHVLEHPTDSEMKLMLDNFKKYSNKGVNIRIAVPDGFHTDKKYIEWVRPGGTGAGADDHKHLFNYRSLSEYFEQYGFKSFPVEYWDEKGKFHSSYRNDEKGYVLRSFINDDRNKDGKPHYTSLIIDFRLR
jgi:predicted SAM-dependent methyltransferase